MRCSLALWTPAIAGANPFAEIPPEQFFEPLKGFKPAPASEFKPKAQIPRFTNITHEQFVKLVRRGQPFVVDDCVKDHPMMGFVCKDFSEKWPKGQMKAEYSGGGRTTLGDPAWYSTARPAKGWPDHMTAGRRISGPYVWHVKDEEPLPVKRSVQEYWKTPYFLNGTHMNRLEAWDSFEMWFSLPDGGAMAHSDSYNEMTISAQFTGTKKWRLMMFPELNTIFDSFESFDTGVYKVNKWAPEYEFDVGPGQCFVFPPGYMHETWSNPDINDVCATATTFQFNAPFPAQYIRNFLPRFSNSHLVSAENAMEIYSSYATIAKVQPKPTSDKAEIQRRVDSKFADLDADKDGKITEEELRAFFLTNPKGKWGQAYEFAWTRYIKDPQVKKEMAKERGEYRAGDTLAWHDLNEDGHVSKEELLQTFTQWNVLVERHRALMKAKASKKAVAQAKTIEEKYAKEYMCPTGPSQCPVVDRIRAKKGKNRESVVWFQGDEDEEKERKEL